MAVFGNQGSRAGDDDSVDDVRVESTPRRGCSGSSGGDDNDGGDSGSGSGYSNDGVGSLVIDDEVCVFTGGDGMMSPRSSNLFFDTTAFSDQERLQSALALFAKFPRFFKQSNRGSGSPLPVAASQDSAILLTTYGWSCGCYNVPTKNVMESLSTKGTAFS
jgi:hypothetical protein